MIGPFWYTLRTLYSCAQMDGQTVVTECDRSIVLCVVLNVANLPLVPSTWRARLKFGKFGFGTFRGSKV